MNTRFLRTAILVAFAATSTVSFGQDETPSRVGRISMSQGQVGITGEVGDETSAGVVNWPVTSRNQITTGRDGRTEVRIGSTAIRLDADSAMDVTELDDDSLRVHLHYGSANIRIRSLEAVRGFEMSTPQGLVRLQDPGQIRVDSGRRQDTTVVSVFTGSALVEGGGSRMTVRSGKRAEFRQDDFNTGLAMRDSFDEWSLLRDLRDERSESARYVTTEMTGYEELDQHGMWRESSDYGPLWQPRHVPVNWVPYRDGRWTYLQPWGWTWVDNAPWGYAPFHYGRWVMVNQRWCWAPGRNISRVVWSPALVGWVGGSNVSVTFGGARMPAQGWYPLSPRDSYIPGYRMRDDHLRYVNRYADDRGSRRHRDYRPAGLTVVPHSNFEQRGTVIVPSAPKPTGPVGSMITNLVSQVLPPVPQGFRQRDGDGRRRDGANYAQSRDGFAAPAGIQPAQAGASQPRRGNRDHDGRRGNEGVPPVAATAGATIPQPAAMPGVQRTDGARRFGGEPDAERERRPRGAESFQMQQAQQQQQAQQRQIQLQQEQQRQVQEQEQRVQRMQAAQREDGVRGVAQQAALRQQQDQLRQQQEQQARMQQEQLARMQQRQQQEQQMQQMQRQQQDQQARAQQQAQQREEGIRGLAQQAAMRQQQEQQRQQQEQQMRAQQQQEQMRAQQQQQQQQQRAAQQQSASANAQGTTDNSRERRRAREDTRER